MWRLVIAGLLILHGILHAVVWLPRQQSNEFPGFGPQVSWLFAEVRAVVVALVMTAGIGFVLAGVAYGMHLDLWAVPAIVAVVASMALIVATFTPWWGLAIVINAITLYAAWQSVRGD